MAHILTIGGSPSVSSRSAGVLEHARDFLHARGLQTSAFSVRDLDSEELLCGKANGPTMLKAKAIVASADGVIIGLAVPKAIYTGALKTFLGLLPQDTLSGKTVLPIVTGSTLANLLSVEAILRSVLTNLGALSVLPAVYILDQQIDFNEGEKIDITSHEAETSLVDGLGSLIEVFASRRERV